MDTAPKRNMERSPRRAGLAASLPALPVNGFDFLHVRHSYSHPCDTQHVLLLAAAGWFQPQGPISSRAGSCLLLQRIFGNGFCIPSSFLLGGGFEFLTVTARLVQ